MGARVGAWVIDGLILSGFQIGFWMLAVAVGAISINPEAQLQMEASPLTLPTVAPYRANLPLLAAMLAVFVVLNVAYAALFWARLRGTPGQRMLSLQVGSAATGKNLSFEHAFARAVVAVGIPLAAAAGFFYGAIWIGTSSSWSEVRSELTNPRPGGPADAWLSVWSTVLVVVMLVAVMWPILLLMWTAVSPTKQGLHDRLAGSLVVGKGRASWAGAAQRPGYGPGFGPPPGYVPPPGYGSPPAYGPGPGAWPPGAIPDGIAPYPALGPSTGEAASNEQQDGAPTDPTNEPEAPAGSPDSQPNMPPPAGPGPLPWTGGWTGPDGPALGRPDGASKGPVWLQSEGESNAPQKLQAATVGRRISGYIFDCVLVYMLFSLTASMLAAALLPSSATSIDERTYILLGLVGGFMQLAYFTASWALWQGTLGQRLLHLQVADATTGKSLAWMDALVRWAVLQGPFALVTIVPEAVRPLVLLAASSWALYLLYTTTNNSDLRGLHDRFINSRVGVAL